MCYYAIKTRTMTKIGTNQLMLHHIETILLKQVYDNHHHILNAHVVHVFIKYLEGSMSSKSHQHSRKQN